MAYQMFQQFAREADRVLSALLKSSPPRQEMQRPSTSRFASPSIPVREESIAIDQSLTTRNQGEVVPQTTRDEGSSFFEGPSEATDSASQTTRSRDQDELASVKVCPLAVSQVGDSDDEDWISYETVRIEGGARVPARNGMPWLAQWDWSHREATVEEANMGVEASISSRWVAETQSRIPIRDPAAAVTAIPSRVGVQGRQRHSRIPVFNGQVKMPRRSTSVVRHERKEQRRRQWRAPGNVPVDSTSAGRDSLPPSTVFAKEKDPAKIRRQLFARPKPRSGVEVFREVVLNLCWEEDPEPARTATALDIAEAMYDISNAIRKPHSSKRFSKAQLDANFDCFAREFRELVQVVEDRISRYRYEEGAMLPRNQNGLHRFMYEAGYPFGLDVDTKDEVFVHFGYSVGLSPAALATLGPEWGVDPVTGRVTVAEDVEEEEEGEVPTDSSDDGFFSGQSVSSESAYSEEPVVIYPSIFEDEPEPEPASNVWRIFSTDGNSGKASPLAVVPAVEEAAAGVDKEQVREPESNERPVVVETAMERMNRIKEAIRRMKEREGTRKA
ncbi:hypothetical protein K440DRAFT_677658 [Wilcoxina mikolae CBS 423.85]|nr:hypothetical protein K440DRAFT_677658 [Wilcoxina mikolae CBS 423.85]